MAQDSWQQDAEETNCQPSEGPVLCTNNCGFFGSAVTLGMCSKCYRDFVLKQAKASSAKSATEKAAALPELLTGQRGMPERMQSDSSYLAVHLPSAQSEGGTSSEGGELLDLELVLELLRLRVRIHADHNLTAAFYAGSALGLQVSSAAVVIPFVLCTDTRTSIVALMIISLRDGTRLPRRTLW